MPLDSVADHISQSRHPIDELALADIKSAILGKLTLAIGKDAGIATTHDWYKAAALALRDRIVHRWLLTEKDNYDAGRKRVYYLSLEFLIGRLFTDALNNMGLLPLFAAALGDLGVDLNELRIYAGDDMCNMTKLALNLSGFVNGVAVKHAETTQQMFPGYKVSAITNGVHAARWATPRISRSAGTRWRRAGHAGGRMPRRRLAPGGARRPGAPARRNRRGRFPRR